MNLQSIYFVNSFFIEIKTIYNRGVNMDNIINLKSYYKDKYDFNCDDFKQLSHNINEFKSKFKSNNIFELAEKIGFKFNKLEMEQNILCKIDDNNITFNKYISAKVKSAVVAVIIMNYLLNINTKYITISQFKRILRNDYFIVFIELLLIDGQTYLNIFKSLEPLNISMDKAFKIIQECFGVSYFIAFKRYEIMLKEKV